MEQILQHENTINHFVVASRGGKYGNLDLYSQLHQEIIPDAEAYIRVRGDGLTGLGRYLTVYGDYDLRTLAIIDAPVISGTEVTVETTLLGLVEDFHSKLICAVHIDVEHSNTLRIQPGSGHVNSIDPAYYNPHGPKELQSFLSEKYPFIYFIESTSNTSASVLGGEIKKFRQSFDAIYERHTPHIIEGY